METAMDLQERVEEIVRRRIAGRSRKAQEVREELAAHLLQSVRAHLAEGVGEEEAVERAVAALGALRPLRRWLLWDEVCRKVFALDALFAFLALCCALLGCLLPAWVTAGEDPSAIGRASWLTIPMGACVLAATLLVIVVSLYRQRKVSKGVAFAYCCAAPAAGIAYQAACSARISGWGDGIEAAFLCFQVATLLAVVSYWTGRRRSGARANTVAE